MYEAHVVAVHDILPPMYRSQQEGSILPQDEQDALVNQLKAKWDDVNTRSAENDFFCFTYSDRMMRLKVPYISQQHDREYAPRTPACVKGTHVIMLIS